MDESLENYGKWKKSVLSIYVMSLKWQNYRNGECVNSFLELKWDESGKGVGVAIKGQPKGFLGCVNVLYLTCINVNIQAVMLYYA